MFEHLRKHDRLLVTGPQRSGTTICAKMISVDTGHTFLSEAHLVGGSHIDDQWHKLADLVKTRQRIVVQCPSLSRWIHDFSSEDTLIVFMRRKIRDIVASEKRIGWGDSAQRAVYKKALRCYEFPATVAEAKYLFWEEVQRSVVHHWLEIEFESLKDHPLWVPAERRVDFGPRQISEDGRFAAEISGG